MARNFTRSSSGRRRVGGKVQEAVREIEPGELAIEEAVRAPEEALRRCDVEIHDPDATVMSCSPSQWLRG